MKNENGSFLSFLKSWPFWIIIAAFSFTCFFIYQNRKVLNANPDKEMKVCSDSLALVKSENAALRKVLSEKLISYCDTATVDQKLAQQKLDDYTYKMYEIKEAQNLKAYELKQKSELKAYTDMDHEKVQVIFTEYWEVRCQALLEIEKTDPAIFNEYAATVYKRENFGYGNYKAEQSLYEKLTKLKKNPLVAKFLSKEKAADVIKTQKDSENEKRYQVKLAEIEMAYQTQLLVIEQNYNKKIAAKKAELGL